ncbi:unnamed protein product [Paramecium sonneborni]|uniref:Uncharacterized protein n=1 Tax=Paramecium sonneborni TaxID=65129 RepID=A0A8S1RF34_9CILI|nr:unnamed protein product [Paramecium sonneborni]
MIKAIIWLQEELIDQKMDYKNQMIFGHYIDRNLAGIWKELIIENQQLIHRNQAACISDDKIFYIFGDQKFLESKSTNKLILQN